VLLKFENQDLENLDEQSSRTVGEAIDAIIGKQDPNRFPRFEPRLFSKIPNTRGEVLYILVEEAPLIFIPGEAKLRIHIFDTSGNLLSGDDFSTGWRTTLTGMKIRSLPTLGKVLAVEAAYCLGGSPSLQYYAVVGKRIAPIYFARVNPKHWDMYEYEDPGIGPSFPELSVADWERALNSSNTVEVMAALVWLGRTNRDGPWQNPDAKAEAAKVQQLRSSGSVHKRLLELSQSEDWWVQAEAKAASKND